MSTKEIHKQSYYELLEIEPNASQEEILKAYNRARATYGNNSPALYSLFNKEEAQELLKLIDEAYAVLSNQFKRKQYDRGGEPAAADPSPGQVPAPTSPKPETQATKTAQAAAEGYGTTKFGKYKIDPQFEETLKSIDCFSGATLQKIRLYKNITLDQIAESTKISRSYLMAVEANDQSRLPAQVFVRGFLVQFGKILGLDGNRVAASYLENLKQKAGP
jgi:DnaJ-class molecular chaperone